MSLNHVFNNNLELKYKRPSISSYSKKLLSNTEVKFLENKMDYLKMSREVKDFWKICKKDIALQTKEQIELSADPKRNKLHLIQQDMVVKFNLASDEKVSDDHDNMLLGVESDIHKVYNDMFELFEKKALDDVNDIDSVKDSAKEYTIEEESFHEDGS